MNSVAIVTFGIAAAWLVSWVFELRSASHISAHARAQLGLRPDLVNHTRPRPTLSRSSQLKLLIGFAISIVATLMIGPVGVFLGAAPPLVLMQIYHLLFLKMVLAQILLIEYLLDHHLYLQIHQAIKFFHHQVQD